MTKSNFKKSVMTSFKWRHGHYVTEKRHQKTSQFFPFWATPIKIFGYASVQVPGGSKIPGEARAPCLYFSREGASAP